jgi:hypothetical protein
MQNIKEYFITFLRNEDIKREINQFVKPIVNTVYNEIYIYVWFICIYSVLLLVITLGNLFILLKMFYFQNLDKHDSSDYYHTQE